MTSLSEIVEFSCHLISTPEKSIHNKHYEFFGTNLITIFHISLIRIRILIFISICIYYVLFISRYMACLLLTFQITWLIVHRLKRLLLPYGYFEG